MFLVENEQKTLKLRSGYNIITMIMNKTQEKKIPVTVKTIAVWGNPNSGKTLFSVKLAKGLSKDKNVILVFTDIFTPTLDVVLPFENGPDKSIGKILEIPILTQEDILKELVISNK